MKNNLLQNIFFISLIFFTSFLAFRQIFFSNSFVLGGEADYYFNFTQYSKTFLLPWLSKWGMGYYNPLIAGTGFNVFFLILMEKITSNNYLIINQLLFYFIVSLPAVSIFILLSFYKINKFVNYLISIFYIFNPFSIDYLHQLNQWTNVSLIFIPILFIIMTCKFKSNIMYFLILFIFFNLISFSFANPPTFLIYIIATAAYSFINSFNENKYDYRKNIFDLLIVLLALFLSNFYWIYNLIHNLATSGFAVTSYNQEYATGYLKTVLINSGPMVSKLFTFSHLSSDSVNHFTHYTKWFSSLYVKLFLSIFVVLIISINLLSSNIKFRLFAFFTLFFAFFTKGIYPPFSVFYFLLYKFFPYFNIFKTPTEKFGILFLVFFTICIGLFSKKFNRLYSLIVLVPLYCILIVIPFQKGFITGYSIPSPAVSKINSYLTIDRVIDLDKDFFETIKAIEGFHNNYRFLVLPGNYNYQIFVKINGKIYSGMDPLLNNTSKDFITFTHSAYNNAVIDIFDSINGYKYYKHSKKDKLFTVNDYKENVFEALGSNYIGYVVLFKNVYPIFGFYNNQEQLLLFNRNFSKDIVFENKYVKIYDLTANVISNDKVDILNQLKINYILQ